MIQRLVAVALRMPFIVLATAVCSSSLGLAAYERARHRGLPEPGARRWSRSSPSRRVERRGGRALRHDPARDRPLGHAGARAHPLAVALRPERREVLLRLGHRLQGRPQEVINRLQFVQLPDGLQAQLSPWNAIGEVFRYRVVGKGYTLTDLKTAEDWILERQFKQVQGVIDVTSYGGETKQYHVEVDPYRLRGQGVTLDAAHQRDPERQPERRRPAPRHGRAGVRRARHRPRSQRHRARHREHRRRRAEGHARPRAGHRRRRHRLRAAPGHRRLRRRPRRRAGHRAHALRRRDAARRSRASTSSVDYIRAEPHPAAGHGHRAVLRPRQPGEAHDAHGRSRTCSSGWRSSTIVLLLFLGHARAALITALNIPLALLIAFCGLVGDGHVGEPHLARRGRLRHRRRLDRHHDGEHLPAPRAAREGHDDRAHPAGRARGRRRR